MAVIATFYDHVRDISRQERISMMEALGAARELGVQALEISGNNLLGREDEVGQELAYYDLGISSIPAYFDFGKNGDVKGQATPFLEAAQYLGAPRLLVIPGFVEEGASPQEREEQTQRMVEGVCRLGDLALDYGVSLAMEEYDSPRAPFARTGEVQRFLEACPALECAFDSGNFRYAGGVLGRGLRGPGGPDRPRPPKGQGLLSPGRGGAQAGPGRDAPVPRPGGRRGPWAGKTSGPAAVRRLRRDLHRRALRGPPGAGVPLPVSKMAPGQAGAMTRFYVKKETCHMTKRERVLAALAGKPLDRIPAGFSLHFPREKNAGEAGGPGPPGVLPGDGHGHCEDHEREPGAQTGGHPLPGGLGLHRPHLPGGALYPAAAGLYEGDPRPLGGGTPTPWGPSTGSPPPPSTPSRRTTATTRCAPCSPSTCGRTAPRCWTP